MDEMETGGGTNGLGSRPVSSTSPRLGISVEGSVINLLITLMSLELSLISLEIKIVSDPEPGAGISLKLFCSSISP